MTSARTAVLLNPNARRVSRHVVSRIRRIVADEDLFVSDDERAADRALETIVERGYDAVFTGGGDGTVTRLLNALPDHDALPPIGILRLGTGNAMAELVATRDPIEDLRAYAERGDGVAHLTLPLCEAEGTRFAFGGLGIDAQILNDYNALKRRLRGRALRRLRSVGGYLAAAATMTIPRHVARWLQGRDVRVTVTNEGAPASAIAASDGAGRVFRTFNPGEVLYDGPANAVLFGTCPYYGYRLKVLPFAGVDPTRFHLRVSNVPATRIVAQLPKVWAGTLEHPGFHDFHVSRVRLTFSEPMPYQIAGEAMGERRELVVGMAPRPVELLRLN